MNVRILPTALVALGLLGAAACNGADEETQLEGENDTTAVAGPAAAPPAAAPAGTFIDPDAATREELLAVPGMTPEAADAVIAGRPYTSIAAVDKALPASMTEAQKDTIFARVWKPIDLNTATDEEIQLIPGVGDRMLHEFKEYRPYQNIEQFRREIGKYVDAAEVARLESYVRIGQ